MHEDSTTASTDNRCVDVYLALTAQRYCDEFDFRWDEREVTDVERREHALKQSVGKRLMYREPVEKK